MQKETMNTCIVTTIRWCCTGSIVLHACPRRSWMRVC